MSFKIITDSTADLPDSYVAEHDIIVLGMTVTVGDDSYETVGEGRLTNDTLLAEIAKGKKVQTAQVNSGQFLEVFKASAQAGEEVLYLAFSSGLSGTYQSSVMAREMALEEFPEAKITVFDTLAAASGEGFIVEEVVKLREAGHSVEEVVSQLEHLSTHLQSLFMVDDLNHLALGGRISKAVAVMGTMANIKPLLYVDKPGTLQQAGRVRGKKKALNSLIKDTLEGMDTAYSKVIVSYSGEDATAQEIKACFLEAGVQEVEVRPLSPTIVTHTGAGTIAIFSMGRNPRA
ncbi:DegV family protein [Lactococcus termiticola]|uniref:DegV family protein n=1 Tax=Lactococcus termiticola TaxID=2169526 RepID=A0A2R5HGA9_9LACT|nr:DegV family protein [Lactococcus termiticola]GBG97022.1 DegV family protein [Lactococcus termiticola]